MELTFHSFILPYCNINPEEEQDPEGAWRNVTLRNIK